MSKFLPDIEIFEVFCDNIFLGQTFVSILWSWPKYLSLHHRISSGPPIIPNFPWISWVLIRSSSRTPQIQRTIPLSADFKRLIVSLCSGHVLQPYRKLRWAEMLPRYLGEIPQLVMICNSCLKPFRAAVVRVLVAFTHPPDSPNMLPRYWKVGTASNVF